MKVTTIRKNVDGTEVTVTDISDDVNLKRKRTYRYLKDGRLEDGGGLTMDRRMSSDCRLEK